VQLLDVVSFIHAGIIVIVLTTAAVDCIKLALERTMSSKCPLHRAKLRPTSSSSSFKRSLFFVGNDHGTARGEGARSDAVSDLVDKTTAQPFRGRNART
jgi:hypothetical protein